MKLFLAVLALLSAVLAAPTSDNSLKLGFINERITNGQDAEFGEFPYICSMQWRLITASTHMCGASVINPNWVLTAAHCYTEVPNLGSVDALCGVTDLTITGTQQRHLINPHIVHPGFVPGGAVGPHDIAVGRLAQSLIFNANVQPVNLPAQDQEPILGTAVLAGWGSTSTTQIPSMPNRLQRVNKPVHSLDECCDLLDIVISGSCDHLGPTNVCAGGGPISACGGDSGGPLSQQVGGSWIQIGVVSWGMNPCGNTVAPSVFVRVSAYRNWIDQNIN